MVSQINEARISESPTIDEDVLKEIKQALSQIQYGSLEISIHNGRIVQLERREKKRFDR
ncbi:MAG: YezD family protein [Cellvibrio sp.]